MIFSILAAAKTLILDPMKKSLALFLLVFVAQISFAQKNAPVAPVVHRSTASPNSSLTKAYSKPYVGADAFVPARAHLVPRFLQTPGEVDPRERLHQTQDHRQAALQDLQRARQDRPQDRRAGSIHHHAGGEGWPVPLTSLPSSTGSNSATILASAGWIPSRRLIYLFTTITLLQVDGYVKDCREAPRGHDPREAGEGSGQLVNSSNTEFHRDSVLTAKFPC